MFPHRGINKYNWAFPDGKTNKKIDHCDTLTVTPITLGGCKIQGKIGSK